MTRKPRRASVAAPLLLCAFLLLVSLPGFAEETALRYWPSWRGPHDNATSRLADPPTSWSEENNIAWKIDVPGRGLASPVVWGDRVFLLTSVPVEASRYEASQAAAAEKQSNKQWPPDVQPVDQRFVVLAIDRASGDIVWQRTATETIPSESHYIDSSWASGSPVTDGEVLVAHFGSNGTYTYDLDGKLLWRRDLGDMETRNGFGEGSSPAIHGDRVIINWDHEGDSFIVALDKVTGSEIWMTERPGEVTSWATPLIVSLENQTQIVVPATGKSRGYDFQTGREIWRLAGMTVNTIPTPVQRNGIVYLASGYRGEILQAVDLQVASGDIEDSKALLWTHERHTPYVASLLLYDDQIYFIKHFKNILTSLDASTGQVLYTEVRLDGIDNVWSSPVGAAGRIYIVGRNGTSLVIEHGPDYRVLASNELDDRFDATPALVDNEIYLRGRGHLYKIVETSPGS